ncbi:MAG TPA: class I SAM-dependent methyltransferase [Jatrophihabitans sp.]|nr:class I SAM-dependent methyltransferase [Jatrophihabitans sp.]
MSSSQAAERPLSTPVTGHYSGSSDPTVWFHAHYERAAREIVEFFDSDGISLTGKRLADIGCGDGIIDLGLVAQAEPASLVGFDVVSTDTDHLCRLARAAGVELAGDALPAALSFVTSEEARLPWPDRSFDYALSWSAFEHVLEPVPLLREVHRVLADNGILFVQLWPFYDSEHGSHLMDWFPEGFAPLRYNDEEILRRMQAGGRPGAAPGMYEAYRTLNRITADGLHAALRMAGFRVVKLQLQSETVHVPDEARDLPPSRIGIGGIKLLAIKDRLRATTVRARLESTGWAPGGLAALGRAYAVRTLRGALNRADRKLAQLATRSR